MVHAICLIILFILLGVWIKYHKKAHIFLVDVPKENYKNLKRHIRKEKNHKWLKLLLDIIILLTSIHFVAKIIILNNNDGYLSQLLPISIAILLYCIDGYFFFTIFFDFFTADCIYFYLFAFAIIIKNIIFNIELDKFLTNDKMKNNAHTQTVNFCSSCRTEVNGEFCENCGDKIN